MTGAESAAPGGGGGRGVDAAGAIGRGGGGGRSGDAAGAIGRGTWIDKLADDMLRREERLGRDTGMIRVESGLGASGIPHIGSLGDAVRAYGVKMAVEDTGRRSELIAYSDDLDGLRKVPDGMPASLAEHIARPVSLVPDPFGACHGSYGEHMSSLLLEGLDALGVRYVFKRARDEYARGSFRAQTAAILAAAGRIGERIEEMVGQSKFRGALPYFPVCHACGRLYTARAESYDPGAESVSYVCRGADVGGTPVEGCGHAGESRIGRDLGKLAWKAEFAARWQAFDVRFEAYGKDIMDSVRVNDWVCQEVLGTPPPHHARYEMFLDKGGRKISKSAGNVLTAQKWLRYAAPESVLLLMFKRISGAREVGLGDVPALMDEYAGLEAWYYGVGRGGEGSAGGGGGGGGRGAGEGGASGRKRAGLFEYVRLLDPPAERPPGCGALPRYGQLVELCRTYTGEAATAGRRTEMVLGRLAGYVRAGGAGAGAGAGAAGAAERIAGLVEMAARYADEVAAVAAGAAAAPGGGAGAGAGAVDGELECGGEVELDAAAEAGSRRGGPASAGPGGAGRKAGLPGAVRGALCDFAAALDGMAAEGGGGGGGEPLADRIQAEAFSCARGRGARPRDMFAALYGIMLGASRGPRLGPLIEEVGLAKARDLIRERAG